MIVSTFALCQTEIDFKYMLKILLNGYVYPL